MKTSKIILASGILFSLQAQASPSTVQSYSSTIDTMLSGCPSGQFWTGTTCATPSGSSLAIDVTQPPYNGDNTGGVDATAAFNAAEAALPSSGGRIITHGGTYKLCSLGTTVNITKPTEIDFEGGTINFACSNVLGFNINTTGAQVTRIHDFHATAPSTHTGNYFFSVTSLNFLMDHYNYDHHYRFVDVEDSQTATFRDFYANTPAVGGGSGDYVLGCTTGNGDILIQHGYSTAPDSSHQASFGVEACNGDSYTFDDVFEILHGNDFLINPQSGQTMANVHMKNVVADTSVNGIVVQPAGGGTVVDMTIDDTWASVQTGDGILLDATNGPIQNVIITGGNRITSTVNGVHTVGNVSNLYINEGNVFANTTGLNISSGTTGKAGCSLNVSGNTTNITSPGTGFATGCSSSGGGGTISGYILYAGTISGINAGGSASVTFTPAFPTAIDSIVATLTGGPTTSPIPASIVSKSTTGATIGNASSIGPLGATWIAVGH